MYHPLRISWKYLGYFLKAADGKGHGTHSPFLFHFIKKILNDETIYPAYDAIENLRKKLLRNDRVLTIEDLGAGSSTYSDNRTVSSIAHHAIKQKKYGQLIHRMVKAYRPGTILELGTSLGLTTSYMALGNPDCTVYTIEGSKDIANEAKGNFNSLGISNIKLIVGNFDDQLGIVLNEVSTLDLVFIDGNHRKEPTERYFRQLLPKLNNESILIFDDIHWSPGMEEAWRNICNDPAVKCTVDLFFIGIVFFRREFFQKQHFTIRF